MAGSADATATAAMSGFTKALKESRHIVILAGAGLSAGSGLATFRGSGGLWRRHDAMNLATPQAFKQNPSLVWSFYYYRLLAAEAAQPNEGHRAIASLQAENLTSGSSHPPGREVTLVTQNVDGLSRRAAEERALQVDARPTAGNENSINKHLQNQTFEMHGSIRKTICTSCKKRDLADLGSPMWDPLKPSLTSEEHVHVPTDQLPHCSCGGLLRPGVVWFGELPHSLDVIDTKIRLCDMLVVVGTSNTVYPAAGYAREAQRYGAKVAVFNSERSDGDHRADYLILGPCEQTLPEALTAAD